MTDHDENVNTEVSCVLGRQVLKGGRGLYRLRILPKGGIWYRRHTCHSVSYEAI